GESKRLEQRRMAQLGQKPHGFNYLDFRRPWKIAAVASLAVEGWTHGELLVGRRGGLAVLGTVVGEAEFAIGTIVFGGMGVWVRRLRGTSGFLYFWLGILDGFVW